MLRLRKISIVFLVISGFIGLIRGYRMTGLAPGKSIFFAYEEDSIRDSIFSNYNLLGWIIFFLIGIFSFIVLICVLRKTRTYCYLVIAEGIFLCFFALTHILHNGFSLVHLFMLPFCIGTIALGIMQTPREF